MPQLRGNVPLFRDSLNMEIKGKSSRKISTKEKTVLHMMNMVKAIVTLKEYSLWLRKLIK
jgi:hypothetical protein